METLAYLAHGAAIALAPLNLALIITGLFVGVIAGAVPGISFVNAMALSLPFTYFMSPLVAMMFLGGIYVGGVFGGSISSILLNIPGDPDSVPSCWDGYPLAKREGVVHALSIAITASAIGGLVSAFILTFAAPPFARFALTFDQPEFFAATMLGLVSVLAICRGNMVLGLVSLLLGLALGSMGADPLYGVNRLTFGFPLLENGIDFVVVMIGIFAIGEVLEEFSAIQHTDLKVRDKAKMGILSLKHIWRMRASISRGTITGCLVGLIPGGGAAFGAFLAYGLERQINKRGDEFGTGVEDGLAGALGLKNATTGTAMIPMLTLGIPSSAASAIMLAALMLHQVQPGPLLFSKNPEMIYAIFAAFILANVLMIVVSMIVARFFGALMRTNPTVLYAFILVLSLLGAFAVRNNVADIFICLAFGIVGYFMRRHGFPTAPMVIGVVLGPLAEGYFMNSIANYGTVSVFVTRPASGLIILCAVLFVVWFAIPRKKAKMNPTDENALPPAADGAAAGSKP
jgi:putative tricarboxylic transport membrane protein